MGSDPAYHGSIFDLYSTLLTRQLFSPSKPESSASTATQIDIEVGIHTPNTLDNANTLLDKLDLNFNFRRNPLQSSPALLPVLFPRHRGSGRN